MQIVTVNFLKFHCQQRN